MEVHPCCLPLLSLPRTLSQPARTTLAKEVGGKRGLCQSYDFIKTLQSYAESSSRSFSKLCSTWGVTPIPWELQLLNWKTKVDANQKDLLFINAAAKYFPADTPDDILEQVVNQLKQDKWEGKSPTSYLSTLSTSYLSASEQDALCKDIAVINQAPNLSPVEKKLLRSRGDAQLFHYADFCPISFPFYLGDVYSPLSVETPRGSIGQQCTSIDGVALPLSTIVGASALYGCRVVLKDALRSKMNIYFFGARHVAHVTNVQEIVQQICNSVARNNVILNFFFEERHILLGTGANWWLYQIGERKLLLGYTQHGRAVEIEIQGRGRGISRRYPESIKFISSCQVVCCGVY